MNERQSDFERLQQFIRGGHQPAFRDLVHRHIDLVYATALRKVGDAGGAEEIAQNVFSALARKAWRFAPDDSLPAWLHKTTLLEAKSWLRGELRRRREQTATELGTTMKAPDEQPAFNALVPLLDEALLSLREKDRTALLLRYYESQSLRDVGAALGVSDDTAQKRVASALEKLAHFFQRRGYQTATVAAAAAALQHTAAAASTATVSAVANAALQAAPPALAGLSLLMARLAGLSKWQTAAACATVVALPLVWQWQEHRAVAVEAADVQQQWTATNAERMALEAELEKLRGRIPVLESAVAEAGAAAAERAEAADEFAAWKQRMRERLFAVDYQWPDDSPFVRIHKSVLPHMRVHQPILPPGEIHRGTRELLGLSPKERRQGEALLQNHFARLGDLTAEKCYETNRPSRDHYFPAEKLAANVWVVPPLGEEARAGVEALRSGLRETLGAERWQLVQNSLEGYGVGTLQSVLQLDAPDQRQEVAVWIQESVGELKAHTWLTGSMSPGGYWSVGPMAFPLELFLPGATPSDNEDGFRWERSLLTLPDTVTQRMFDWLQREAVARLNQEGGR